jgi:hypothetical protein
MTLILVIFGSAMLLIGSTCSVGAAYHGYNIDRFVLAYSGPRRHGKPTLLEVIQAVNPQLIGKMTPGVIKVFWAGLFLTLLGNAILLIAAIAMAMSPS